MVFGFWLSWVEFEGSKSDLFFGNKSWKELSKNSSLGLEKIWKNDVYKIAKSTFKKSKDSLCF